LGHPVGVIFYLRLVTYSLLFRLLLTASDQPQERLGGRENKGCWGMGAPEIRCIPYIFKFMSAFFGGAGRSRERDAASELRHIIPSKMCACVCVCIFVVRFIVSIKLHQRHKRKKTDTRTKGQVQLSVCLSVVSVRDAHRMGGRSAILHRNVMAER